MKKIKKEIEEGTFEQPQGMLKIAVEKLTSIFKPWMDEIKVDESKLRDLKEPKIIDKFYLYAF